MFFLCTNSFTNSLLCEHMLPGQLLQFYSKVPFGGFCFKLIADSYSFYMFSVYSSLFEIEQPIVKQVTWPVVTVCVLSAVVDLQMSF